MAVNPLPPNPDAEINLVYKPSEDDQKWRRHVYQRRTDMAAARQEHDVRWDKEDKQYEAWRPPKDTNDWQSNIVPPFTTSIVEAEISELVEQLKHAQAAGRGEEDKAKATIVNYLLDYLWEIGDGDLESYKVLKDALVHGTGIAQEYYWKDQRQVSLLANYDPETGKATYKETTVSDFDDEYMEAVKLQDFFVDESARSINRGPYRANDCIRRYVMPLENFRAVYTGPIWDPNNMAQYVKPGGDTNYYEYYKPPQGIGRNEVEVLWYWSRTPDKLVVVANDVVLRSTPNPYNHKQLPFAQAIDIMRPHQFYHKGDVELLESIQEELTTIRRQRIDRVHLDTDKMFLVSNREVLTDQDLIVAPHKPIYVEDPNTSIKALEYNQTPQSAYLEEDRLKEDGERVTGMDVRSQSVNSSGTATAAAILKEATTKRLQLKLWLLARTFMIEVTRLRVANIQQHYTQPKLEAIAGGKADELKGQIDSANITTINNQDFKKVPRIIRTTDVQLNRTPSGLVNVEAKRGQNYFSIEPSDVVPSHGSFDIKLSIDPTFPVSKPLLQQRTNELFQHPIMMQAFGTGLLDLKKGADKLLEVNDFDPQDFEAQSQNQPAIDPQQAVDLANIENQKMIQGEALPGTPYAPVEHTQIHLAFMASPDFVNAVKQNPQVLINFIKHIATEEALQAKRPAPGAAAPGQAPSAPGSVPSGAPGVPGGAPGSAQGAVGGGAQAVNPAQQVGPTGMTGG